MPSIPTSKPTWWHAEPQRADGLQGAVVGRGLNDETVAFTIDAIERCRCGKSIVVGVGRSRNEGTERRVRVSWHICQSAVVDDGSIVGVDP